MENESQSPPDSSQMDLQDEDPYGEPIYGDEYDQSAENLYGEDEIQVPAMIGRRTSEYENSQCDRSNLQKVIRREVSQINDIIFLGEEWAMIYYYLCGWNRKLVESSMDANNTHKKMLNYKPGDLKFANLGPGECMICACQGEILRNLCGDEFCIDCWKGQISFRMRDYQDPFPPCINEDCSIRISHKLIDEISSRDKTFEKLYVGTICRSYAQLNKSVKVCLGMDCTTCFFIKKPLEVAMCKNCENFVCLCCGREHHTPAECHDFAAWRKITEDSVSFIVDLNYRICPKCKEAVERHSGCNSMICRCKNQFCYICGQNWLPNHKSHGLCYKQKEVKQLQTQRKKKKQNQKQYSLDMRGTKAEQERLQSLYKKISNFKLSETKQKIVETCKIFESDLHCMGNMLTMCRLALLYMMYGSVSIFLQPNMLIKETMSNLKQPSEEIDNFFFLYLPDLIKSSEFPNIEIYKKNLEQKERIALMKNNPIQAFMNEKKRIAEFVSSIEKFLEVHKKL